MGDFDIWLENIYLQYAASDPSAKLARVDLANFQKTVLTEGLANLRETSRM